MTNTKKPLLKVTKFFRGPGVHCPCGPHPGRFQVEFNTGRPKPRRLYYCEQAFYQMMSELVEITEYVGEVSDKERY